MFYLQAYGLALLELTFVIVTLMLLHALKPIVGNIAFYVSLGATLVFAQFVTAAGINVSYDFPGLNIDIGSTIFFTPLMAALLITYIVDGTLEAQRLILGIMSMVGIYIYFSLLSERQCNFPGFELYPHVPKSFMGPLFQSVRYFMLASLLSILVVFLVLPVVYQLMRNRNVRLSVSVFGALIFTEVLDAFFYELATNYPADDWWEGLRETYLTRAVAMTWVSALTTLYLGMKDVRIGSDKDSRNPLDIVWAFLGSYGQARRLQANVREWEGRYRVVVENTNDLIFLVDKSGIILDANRMALQTLGYGIDELARIKIQSIARTDDGSSWLWSQTSDRLFVDEIDEEESDSDDTVIHYEWQMITRGGQTLDFDTSLSPIKIQQSEAVLLVARNITQRKELERERESLQTQLVASQRMEAVGKLAGGIAHDYNNLLHAIQGSLDMLETVTRNNNKARELTSNITSAVKRASTLTGQLLAFARGGKYKVVRIDVRDLVTQTERLFRPMLGKKMALKVVVHPDPMKVEGDFTQLEQVLLNILLNAMESLENGDGKIIVRAEPATEFTPGWADGFGPGTPDQHGEPTGKNRYIVIRVRDDGCGIDDDILPHIFEPFFTSKKKKGIGMGLAMVYGCVENHHGWIHVESEVGKGSEFFIFLPEA